MRKYVENLDRPLTIEKLKPLIGASFDVDVKQSEWGKMVTNYDKLIVSNINLTVDVESGEETSYKESIYMDYYLAGRLKFNAWTGLAGLKKYLNTVDADEIGE